MHMPGRQQPLESSAGPSRAYPRSSNPRNPVSIILQPEATRCKGPFMVVLLFLAGATITRCEARATTEHDGRLPMAFGKQESGGLVGMMPNATSRRMPPRARTKVPPLRKHLPFTRIRRSPSARARARGSRTFLAHRRNTPSGCLRHGLCFLKATNLNGPTAPVLQLRSIMREININST